MIKKILIANRGEIACRVIKSIKKMGLQSVAVYSEIDKNAMHTKMADEAYYIGESPSNKSYLVQEKIIEIAKKTNSDAIHPGYGFLSENAEFARKLKQNNIILIGPSASSMEIMGSKLAAKDAVKKFDIPMVPGTDTALVKVEEAIAVAEETGYPLLIKASAGGGGKGMRIVDSEEDLEEQIKMAMSEAKSAFGDGSVFVEKYISSPRHIEIQILADNFGNTLYLFERECSIQRRHQKVIEEAPSAILDDELRKEMGEAAVLVAKSCEYSGAGTVEFLLDENKNFYFLEMNTRLQVEHPVTEMITGIDLVEEQIRVASGEKLRFEQKDLKINGHAVELRIYAEDPFNNFLPSISKLTKYRLKESDGVRLDNGIEEGMDIPIFYDPMLSKLTVHAENRLAAIEKMRLAISDFEIEGIESTIPFGAFVMNHPKFIDGDFDTHFVKKYFSNETFSEMFSNSAEASSMLIEQLMKAAINKV
jgi:propionyl-CoA carboxylase alpha chain